MLIEHCCLISSNKKMRTEFFCFSCESPKKQIMGAAIMHACGKIMLGRTTSARMLTRLIQILRVNNKWEICA